MRGRKQERALKAGGRVLIPKTTLGAASLWFSGCGFFPDFIIITETALGYARFLPLWHQWTSGIGRGGGICGRGRRSRRTIRVRRSRAQERRGRRRVSNRDHRDSGRRGLRGSWGAWASRIRIGRGG